MKNNLMNRKIINIDKINNIPIVAFKQSDDVILKLSLFANSVILDCTNQNIALNLKYSDSKVSTTIDNTNEVKITINNKNEIDIIINGVNIPSTGKLECDLTLVDGFGKMTTSSFFIIINPKVKIN